MPLENICGKKGDVKLVKVVPRSQELRIKKTTEPCFDFFIAVINNLERNFYSCLWSNTDARTYTKQVHEYMSSCSLQIFPIWRSSSHEFKCANHLTNFSKVQTVKVAPCNCRMILWTGITPVRIYTCHKCAVRYFSYSSFTHVKVKMYKFYSVQAQGD